MNQNTRPVHLNLFKMKFPPMAIVSIFHRITGVLLFLLLPFALYLLHASLHSKDSFSQLQQCLSYNSMKFLSWLLISSVSFHLFAGIRHMVMDCGIGESVCAGRFSAHLVFLCAVVASVLAGVWLW